MNRQLSSQAGSALLIALLLTAMLSLVAIVAMDTSTTDVELSHNVMNSERAFYLAEAGAKHALVTIHATPGWNEGFENVGIGGGAYSVVVSDSTVDSSLVDTVVVVSTGAIRGAEATIEITLVPNVKSPFLKALFGDDAVDVKNSMETDSYNSDSGSYADTKDAHNADVGSNGLITIANKALIGGGVATSDPDGLDIHPGATVNDDTSSAATEDHPAPIAQSEFDWAAANNDNSSGISGSFSYNASTKAFETTGTVTLSSGVYYFSSVILKNSASLKVAPGASVKIYVTGDIELKNSAEVNTAGKPKDFMIYSQGDLILKNGGDVKAVFYSPEGVADLRNSGEFYGAIVAADIAVHNSSKFHYDRSLDKIKKSMSGEMKVVAWREM